MKSNKLIAKHQFILNKYVDDRRELVSKITDHEFAEIAQKELGFIITSSNIAGARNVFDISKKNKSYNGSSHTDIIIIARGLCDTFKSLKVIPSKELSAIANLGEEDLF